MAEESNNSSAARSGNWSAWSVLLPVGVVLGSLQIGLATSYILPLLSRYAGAPFVPTAHSKVSLIFNRLLSSTRLEGKTVYDLG